MLNHPYPVGTKVRLRPGQSESGVEPSTIDTVGQVDTNDSTYRLRGSDGALKNWVSFSSLQVSSVVGWDFLKNALPEDALDLLAGFKGLDALELDDQVVSHILMNLPDLQDRILSAVQELDPHTSKEKLPF